MKLSPIYLSLALTYTSLHAEESLQTILDNIESHTNTTFHLPDSLCEKPVAVDISSGDWTKISGDLIQNFSRIEMANSSGTKNIYLLAADGANKITTKDNPDLQAFEDKTSEVSSQFSAVNPNAIEPFALNQQRLLAMQPGDRFALELPIGNRSIILDKISLDTLGNRTWIGHMEGDELHQTVLTFGEDGLFGRIYAPETIYRIETRDSSTYLMDTAIAGLHLTDQSTDAVEVPTVTAMHSTEARLIPDKSHQSSNGSSSGDSKRKLDRAIMIDVDADPSNNAINANIPAPDTVIDVLILYTDGMSTTRISNMMGLANSALERSGVHISLHMVAAQSVAYTNTNANSAALDDLTYGAGSFAQVNSLRNQYKADLVTLVRPFDYAAQTSCGTGWVNGGGGANFTSTYAFSVVSDGVSGSLYCSDYTLAHELSHSMGSTHDRAHSTTAGHFDYSYGYGMPDNFGTVMSYYWPDVGLFSSPNLSCNGTACGIDAAVTGQSADNVRSLNNVRQRIADLVQ